MLSTCYLLDTIFILSNERSKNMGKFNEIVNITLELLNSSPLLFSLFWGVLGILFINIFVRCFFRIVTQDDSFSLIDFIKDTYEFLNEYFSFKIKLRKLMGHKLTDKELSVFSSFEDEAKIRFKDKTFVTVRDCFNIIFEKDYQIAFHKYNSTKSPKKIIKLLSRFYNLCLCNRLGFDLSYLYDFKNNDDKLILSVPLHIDSFLHGYSGIPFSAYEKK